MKVVPEKKTNKNKTKTKSRRQTEMIEHLSSPQGFLLDGIKSIFFSWIHKIL